MTSLKTFIDFILHLDKFLSVIIQNYGTLTYLFLFLIIFAETGFVVFPFLPGDSLLFAAGAFAAVGALNVFWLFAIITIAAILGDTINYSIGKFLGSKAFKKYPKIFKKEYLEKTENFYKKYGKKTIVLARFVPIVRTFAPFIAGVGKMKYANFLVYNIVGGIIWTALFIFGGYFFGNIPLVKNNFSLTILFIIILSFVPIIWEWRKHKKKRSGDGR
ncbi:MAG TPA: DedA family protein [Candidatus Nanoarchaeia archaeon]|nr:DedA family protein [Candidatus Nanoarchaeia archaeon]